MFHGLNGHLPNARPALLMQFGYVPQNFRSRLLIDFDSSCSIAWQSTTKIRNPSYHSRICKDVFLAVRSSGMLQVKMSGNNCGPKLKVMAIAKLLTQQRTTAHLSPANSPINEAMHRLYVNKKVKADIGEFSRVLLLHGIYHETWAVAKYHRRSLSSWIPSAEKPLPESSGNSSHPSAERSLYLPENPLYSKWRNAACDCIDTLHWAANATIAQNSGAEHATVFHLHASRIVLLTPFGEIGALARSMASWANNNKHDTQPLPELSRLESKVFQWVQRDAHKARLAMIHAGALYWHVRRFSKAAFYEPSAVYLATLAMWAYASYTALATKALAHNRRPGSSRSGSPSPTPPDGISPSVQSNGDSMLGDDPTFIRLDRPNDDEMVQLYVRNGHPSRMKANVTGVGNLSSPMGPERVLREGCKILAPMALTWGVAHEYVRILSAMAEVVSSVRERAANAL